MRLVNFLWDLFCTASIVGIWPRFIEPALLGKTRLVLPISHLQKSITIAHFTDLHLHNGTSSRSLHRIASAIMNEKPDLIAFTGDFICYSRLENPDRLKDFLNRFNAPLGCFAIFGNHDYNAFVSVNDKGSYDVTEPHASSILSGIKRMFYKIDVKGSFTKNIKETDIHTSLKELLEESPFTLLHNECQRIGGINVVGLGEYMAGKCLQSQAFKEYDSNLPGIILSHNPDSLPSLDDQPGDLILLGHTHGGQVNLPYLVHRFIVMEHPEYRHGLYRRKERFVYVNRGVGSVLPFRWRARPEVAFLTLEPL